MSEKNATTTPPDGISGALLTPDMLSEINFLVGEIPTKFGVPLINLLQRTHVQMWVPATPPDHPTPAPDGEGNSAQ